MGSAKRLTLTYAVTALVLFVVLVILGLLMRLGQAGGLALAGDRFYSLMTLHGLGMAGTLFIAGLAAVWLVAFRYASPSLALMRLIYALVLAGTLGLVAATLLGRFGPGWYLLYPLPFISTWPRWSTGLAVISLLVLGVAWLLAQLDLLRAFVARYGLGRVLGWDYLRGTPPTDPLPPFVLITTVSVLAGALTTVFGAVLLLLYLFQWLAPGLPFDVLLPPGPRYDALLMKNIVFLFGHTLVNITMYFGIALVYECLPRYTGRAWKTNRVVVLAWNATLALVLLAFFHHLYMDFAQPTGLQVLGQVASYLSAVPATAVTIFGAVGQVYRADLRWRFVPLALVVGLVGWTIGGLAAVVDSTIRVNMFFHNTLWVPGHFHTYFLLGFVIILFGYLYELLESDAERTARLSLALILAGGYGFTLMFYLGGLAGVPRRYASYAAIPIPSVAEAGRDLAALAVFFVSTVLAGVLLYAVAAFRRWRQAWSST